MTRFWLILAAFLGLAASAVPASADITYTLNNGGSILSTPGNYGTVTASQFAADTIRVKIDLLATERFVTTGSHDGIIFSLTGSPNLTDITIQSANAAKFTVQNKTNAPQNPFPTGSFDDSPFLGPFEYAISWNGNGAGSATETSITFDLKFGSNMLLSPTLFQAVTGAYFAIDIGTGCSTTFKNNDPNQPKTECAATGAIAATGTPTQLPEPGTITMSIAGLMGVAGLVMLQRRRKLVRA